MPFLESLPKGNSEVLSLRIANELLRKEIKKCAESL